MSSLIFYSIKVCAIYYPVRQLELKNTVPRHKQTVRRQFKQIGFSAFCALSSDYCKSMGSQVHIRQFSGTMFTTNVCIVEEIRCKCRYNLQSYFWCLPIYSVKLLFNNLLTSDKYIIWSDHDYIFYNHLPDMVFCISDFPLPINRICIFFDGSEFAVQRI